METETTSTAIGTALPVSAPKYTPIAELGRGGMATAYLAAVQGPGGFNKLVVVKRLRPSLAAEAEFLKMFLDEARLSARIDHPNVVHTTEVGFDGEHHYIAMEYLDGQSLEAVIRRLAKNRKAQDSAANGVGGEADMPLKLHLFVISQMLLGLDFAHELKDFDGTPLNVVHRDVSPHNVMVTYEGQVKLLDFGIAKAADSSGDTRTGVMKGKCTYMPAEQFGGRNIDRRADVFAVGVILWQAITGRKLWRGLSDAEIFQRVATGSIPTPSSVAPNVPAELEAICMKALALRPEDRYASAADFHAAIDEYVLSSRELRATGKELGKFVSELFIEDRTKLKSIIEAELGGRASQKNAVVPVLTQTTTGSSTAASAIATSRAGEEPPASSGRRSILPLAAVAVAAVVVAGVALVRGRGPATDVVPPETTQTVDALACQLTVRATPPETKIWFDDAPLEGNPASSAFRRDGVKHRVRGEAPGYQPKVEWVTLDAARVTMDLVLEREAPAQATAEQPAQNEPKKAPVWVPARPPVRGAPSTGGAATPPPAVDPTPVATPQPTTPHTAPASKGPTGPQLDTSDPWAPGKR